MPISPTQLGFVTLLGLWCGWFLDWIISQIPREDAWHGPSRCPSCGASRHGWRGWFPIFRHLGVATCPDCHTAYGRRGLILELVTAVAFLVTVQAFGSDWKTLWFLMTILVLIPVATIDQEFHVIPDSFLLAGLIPVAGLWITTARSDIIGHIIGGGALSLGLLAISVIGRWIYKQDVMGLGDVKFVGWMGLILGWKIGIVALGLGFLLATVVFLILMVLGKVRFKQQVPFGPFLVGGMYLGMLIGRPLLDWYLNNFVYFK